MAPRSELTDTDIEKLFSGAPQFFARSEGHNTGAPHPSVAFPWNTELVIRDLTDHTQIEDKAWSSVTAWAHLVRAGHNQQTWRPAEETRPRAHFYPRCRERPSMLSMMGLERGTMGYQAALEMPVADALLAEQRGFECLAARPSAIVEQRQKMLTSNEGLRHLDETTILDLLMRNGTRYAEQYMQQRRRSSHDLYHELFRHILRPSTGTVAHHQDPYGLPVQIAALVTVLATPNVWIDFSHVEWRIRLGQLLWASPEHDQPADSAELQEERYWALLQILLACELLLRLDAITEGEEQGLETIRPGEIKKFEMSAQSSVKWAINTARAWLENIDLVRTDAPGHTAGGKPAGWLASLSSKTRMAKFHDPGHSSHSRHPTHAFKARHADRQVEGLKHFARELRWPEFIDGHGTRIAQTCQQVAHATPAVPPLASPSSRAHSNKSVDWGGRQTGDDASIRRIPSRRRPIVAALHPSGWLSKTYLSGLILPGEVLCHYLMASLLETDEAALTQLGPLANLCGGFTYRVKGFWSTACVVGRVLAAGKGSTECMGWISTDITPRNLGDGWLNIEVNDISDHIKLVDKKARLWDKTTIEREGAVLGSVMDESHILPDDFIIPYDNADPESAPPNLRIELRELHVRQPDGALDESVPPTTASVHTTTTSFSLGSGWPATRTYKAQVSFTVSDDDTGKVNEYTYSLCHDVYFVTAHPCVPSQHVRILKAPLSPTIRQFDISGSSSFGTTASAVGTYKHPNPDQSHLALDSQVCQPQSLSATTGHPLHKYFTYMPIHLSELLAQQSSSLEDLLVHYSSWAHKPSLTPMSASAAARVLVIDCITGFQPLPQEHEMALSPVVSRSSTHSTTQPAEKGASPRPPSNLGQSTSSAAATTNEAGNMMHTETRRRHFGSDMEILVRAICAEKGWNALISRRRRGCLACAIREAGALGWKVVIRVD